MIKHLIICLKFPLMVKYYQLCYYVITLSETYQHLAMFLSHLQAAYKHKEQSLQAKSTTKLACSILSHRATWLPCGVALGYLVDSLFCSYMCGCKGHSNKCAPPSQFDKGRSGQFCCSPFFLSFFFLRLV